MSYINISCPPYPYFAYSGNAIYRPGDRHRARSHWQYFDLIAVESGCLYMTVMDEVFKLDRGCVLVIPPETYHCGHKGCPKQTLFRWMHFSTENFAIDQSPAHLYLPGNRQITPDLSALKHYLSIPIFQKIPKANFESMMEILRMLETRSIDFYKKEWEFFQPEISILRRQELFMRILAMIAMQPENAGNNRLARTILNHLELHYAESITIESLAQEVHCHPAHLIRCVKQEFGYPPMQLLIRIRIQKACELLLSTEHSIIEVANAVGFSSPSYFDKQFRKIAGCSPREYKKVLINKG